MLSTTEAPKTRPFNLRSSGTSARPFRIASTGVRKFTGWPSTKTCAVLIPPLPNSHSSNSVRPAPASPARPTISPRRRVKLIKPQMRRISSVCRRPAEGDEARRCFSSLPIMARTSSSCVTSEVGRVSTCFPSRSTVTRSEISKTSLKRCEI